MTRKKIGGLGRGLDSLFDSADPLLENENNEPALTKAPSEIPILLIDPNPRQPRKNFSESELAELSESIHRHGVLQPLVLTAREDRYMLVAGERRWRAARLAGLEKVPALVLELDDKEAAEISLVENLQREDLNPLEEAEGIALLMRDYSLTQEEAAERLGKSRPAVANALRLLKLPEEVRLLIREGKLSAGQGRTLLALEDPKAILRLAQRTVAEDLSVRVLEQEVKKAEEPAPRPHHRPAADPELVEWADSLQRAFGTKISLKGNLEKGVLQMHYSRREDLERLYEMFSVITEKEV